LAGLPAIYVTIVEEVLYFRLSSKTQVGRTKVLEWTQAINWDAWSSICLLSSIFSR